MVVGGVKCWDEFDARRIPLWGWFLYRRFRFGGMGRVFILFGFVGNWIQVFSLYTFYYLDAIHRDELCMYGLLLVYSEELCRVPNPSQLLNPRLVVHVSAPCRSKTLGPSITQLINRLREEQVLGQTNST